MRARQLFLSFAVVLTFFGATMSRAQQPVRVALLIGNKDYKPAIGILKNPHNDIEIVGKALKTAGFEVMEPLKDASRSQILQAVRAFSDKLAAAGSDAIGVFYYTGHGAAVGRHNYLMPIEIEKSDAASLEDGGVLQRDIINRLLDRAPNAAHYLIIDACRNNLGGTKGPKGMVPEDRRDGMLIAFATSPDKPASDDGDDAGPFARVLASELVKPAQFDLMLFHNVRIAVDRASRGEQVPWVEDGIRRETRPLLGARSAPPPTQTTAASSPSTPATKTAPTGPSRVDVAQFCQSVASMTSIGVLRSLNESYKGTPMASCAEARLQELLSQLPPPSPKAEPAIIEASKETPKATVATTQKRGFARTSVPPGSFVMFATGSGLLADDGPAGGNSPFTSQIAKSLQARQTDLRDLSRIVQREVSAMTNGRQSPESIDALRSPINLDEKTGRGEKLALVVGVGDYKTLPSLANTNRDADVMNGELQKLGFKVTRMRNPTEDQLRRTFKTLIASITADTTVVIFFAGTGVELNGVNYLAATDAVQPEAGGFSSNRGWIGLNEILETLHRANPKAVVAFIDACRDFPQQATR